MHKKKKQRLLVFDQYFKSVRSYLSVPTAERIRALLSILRAVVDLRDDKRILIPLKEENIFLDPEFREVKFLYLGKETHNSHSDKGERDFQIQARNLVNYLLGAGPGAQ